MNLTSNALQAGWRLFRHNANYILTVVFILSVPVGLAGRVLEFRLSEAYLSVDFDALLETGADWASLQIVAGLLALLVVLGALSHALGQGANAHALNSAWQGDPLPYRTVFARALARILVMLMTIVVQTICIFVGFLLLIVPGIIASLKLCLAPLFVALDRAGPLEALSLSWLATRGLAGAIFLSMLAIWIPFGITMALLGIALEFTYPGITDSDVTVFASDLLTLAFGAFSSCVIFAFYQYAKQEATPVQQAPDLPITAESP